MQLLRLVYTIRADGVRQLVVARVWCDLAEWRVYAPLARLDPRALLVVSLAGSEVVGPAIAKGGAVQLPALARVLQVHLVAAMAVVAHVLRVPQIIVAPARVIGEDGNVAPRRGMPVPNARHKAGATVRRGRGSQRARWEGASHASTGILTAGAHG
eukprot:scaffold262320_cov31-Tisochrysis_lutea.AAC.3